MSIKAGKLEFTAFLGGLLLVAFGMFVIARWQSRRGSYAETPPGARTPPLAAPVSEVGALVETPTDISIVLKPADEPRFERIYTANVGDGFTVEVTMKTVIRPGRYTTGHLIQRDGKSIYFDPENVAERIIDRELYPLVQAKVDEMLALDRAFMASKPSEFVDENGATWRIVRK